jgi:hypothetical protein
MTQAGPEPKTSDGYAKAGDRAPEHVQSVGGRSGGRQPSSATADGHRTGPHVRDAAIA